MSDHIWSQENIAAFVAGGLTPAEVVRLESHLADCPACTRAVEEARQLERRLAPLRFGADPGPALEDRIIRGLPQAASTPWFARLSGNGKIILAIAAALLLACLGAGLTAMEEGILSPKASFTLVPDMFSGALAVDGKEAKGKIEQEILSANDMAVAIRRESRAFLSDDIESVPATKKEKSGGAIDGVPPRRGFPGASGMPPGFANTPPPSSAESPRFESATESKGLEKVDKTLGARPAASAAGGAIAANPKDAYKVPVAAAGFGAGLSLQGQAQGNKDTAKQDVLWMYTDKSNSISKEGVWNDASLSVYNMMTFDKLENELKQVHKEFFKPGEEFAQRFQRHEGRKKGGAVNKSGPMAAARPEEQFSPGFGKGTKATGSAQPPQEVPTPRKIIIRSGELEFEVDSFDASVTTIMRLVSATKGGFVATINSDKLANGKVRGSVVIRVPPDQLDRFVLDLRKELGKTGELKNQHIGSQDITKQYTDLESRLRAARTMEERLLKIIKEGKGQIKDLLQAEKELGVWRTKIEEMEGELRYYSNLVALSTLTIKLFEKEIRLAAAVTENERVQAGIEVEDVEKAHQAALKAIAEAKGRVTRSELKQHAAGQFNAILNFEVAPEAAGVMRDRLKQLGTMVRLQVDRVQQTEGGGPAPRDGKIRRGRTEFFISIYNLANVAPRETVVLRIAAADVPAVYHKLRSLIAKAGGRVIHAKLNEQDRQNIHAELEFDVRRPGEANVLAALNEAGETLSRQVSRIPENDNVTDAKVLYRLMLIDADAIPPREAVTLRIAAADVPAAYRKLRAVLEKIKARIITAQLNEQDPRQVTARLDFIYRRSDDSAVQEVLTKAGDTLSRQVARAPENVQVTDAKVMTRVELIHADSLPARETVVLRIAATDVPGAFQKLRDTVAKAKGRVAQAELNEQDSRNIHGRLSFDIPRSEENTVQTVLAAVGDTLTRKVTRQPENINVTDTKLAFDVDLAPAAGIAPRETLTIALEVSKVAAMLDVFNAWAREAQGRVVQTLIGKDRSGQVTARVIYDVPLSAAHSLAAKFKDAGYVRVDQVAEDPKAPTGKLALGRLEVTLSSELLVPSDQGLWAQIRGGLAFSLRGLFMSANFLIVGLLFVLPWVLLIYVIFLLTRRIWRGPKVAPVPAMASSSPPSATPS
jgi:uncharacterized membrane protein